MDCPQCKEPVLTLEYQAIEIDYCTRCGGVWLDAGELDLILSAGLDGSESKPAEGAVEVGFMRIGSGRRCPSCKRKTETGCLEFAGPAEAGLRSSPAPDLLLERCPACLGMWLNGEELDRLIHLDNSGTIQPLLDWLRGVFPGSRSAEEA